MWRKYFAECAVAPALWVHCGDCAWRRRRRRRAPRSRRRSAPAQIQPPSSTALHCPPQPLTLCPRAGGSGCSQPLTSGGFRTPGFSQAFNWSRSRLNPGGGGTGRRVWALFRASQRWRSVRPVSAGLHQQQPAAG